MPLLTKTPLILKPGWALARGLGVNRLTCWTHMTDGPHLEGSFNVLSHPIHTRPINKAQYQWWASGFASN
jgi:hypothetical protein